LLFPGGIVGSVLFRFSWLGSPVPVLVINSVIYSAVAYLVFYRLKYHLSARRTAIVAVVAVLLACLACVPSLDPLWPQKMAELDEKEHILREGLQVGSDLNSVRAFLRSQGIEAYEYEPKAEEIFLQRTDLQIVAEPGERVISARVDTQAQQFPCSYRIQVVLLIDQQGKVKRRYIARSPLCPEAQSLRFCKRTLNMRSESRIVICSPSIPFRNAFHSYLLDSPFLRFHSYV